MNQGREDARMGVRQMSVGGHTNGNQLKPSKWPLRILSPMGEGARRLLIPSGALMVAARRGLRSNEGPGEMGLTAEFGGGLGIETGELVSTVGCGVGIDGRKDKQPSHENINTPFGSPDR